MIRRTTHIASNDLTLLTRLLMFQICPSPCSDDAKPITILKKDRFTAAISSDSETETIVALKAKINLQNQVLVNQLNSIRRIWIHGQTHQLCKVHVSIGN